METDTTEGRLPPLDYAKPDKELREQLHEMSRPLTPKSERRYIPGRIVPMSVPDLGCPSRKCVRKVGHVGDCWPAG